MSVIVKGGGGGKSSGLYVWKKYEFIPNPYLSFIGNEDFTLNTYNNSKNWDGTLEYSTDTTTWNTWNGTEISSSDSKLYLRGTGNTKITGNSTDYRFVFTGTDTLKITCEGNIENLLDYNTVSTGGNPTMTDYCYRSMFKNCTSLTIAPELPATTLTTECYAYMFDDCRSLTIAPVLPATTLADSCYKGMFYNCRSLTIAPQLPATTLANYCYYSMFDSCTNLTTAPQLPATTLANSCYYRMFDGCTSLTTTPALSATTLANYCYAYMFNGCTLLTTVPALPVTTLTVGCYQYMFSDCTSLTSAPALPATKLITFCYRNMFSGCTNIKLSTTQTGDYQTEYRIPKSGTGTTVTNAMMSMFTNTGGTFTGTPEINTTYYTSNTVV